MIYRDATRGGCFAFAVLLALTIASHQALAQTTTDTFTGGTNSAGWNFNPGADIIEPAGGNPGAWLHNPLLDTFAPILTNTIGINSAFTGNLRTRGVNNISIDAQTLDADFGAGGRDFTLLLRNIRGTPGDPDDDDFAYFVGPLVPQVGEGWKHFSFPIPSQNTSTLPAGWTGGHSGDPENFRPGVTWNDIITQVDVVEFWWLHPAFFAIFQQWDVGVDNVSITVPEPASLGALGMMGLLAARRRHR